MWNFGSGIKAIANENYSVLWGLDPREEIYVSMIKSELQSIVRFFDLIRARRGEKLFLEDFTEIGLGGSEVLDLCQILQIKQGIEAINYDFNDVNNCFIVYTGADTPSR